jgi:hypothetical protein
MGRKTQEKTRVLAEERILLINLTAVMSPLKKGTNECKC